MKCQSHQISDRYFNVHLNIFDRIRGEGNLFDPCDDQIATANDNQLSVPISWLGDPTLQISDGS